MKEKMLYLAIIFCTLFGLYQIFIGNSAELGAASFIFGILSFFYSVYTNKSSKNESIESQNEDYVFERLYKIVFNKRKEVGRVFLVIAGLVWVLFCGINQVEESSETEEPEVLYYDENITDQDFAEMFCEEVQKVLLGADENKLEIIKSKLDNLKEKYDDTVKMNQRYAYTLSQCGWLCFQQGYIYDAVTFTNEALDIVKEFEMSKDNSALIALCYANSAKVLFEQGFYFEAENYFLDAIKCYKDFGIYNTELALTYMDLANYYISRAKYSEALESMEEADRVLKQLNQSNSIQMGLSHIIRARIYQHTDESRVLDELLTAEDILENNKPESNIYLSSLYGDLGAYNRPKNIVIAEKYFRKELDIAQSMQGEFGEATIDAEINLASIDSDYGRIQEAQNKLNSIVIKCEGRYSERKIDGAYAYFKLANVYRELGKHIKAIEYYDDAIRIFEAEYGVNHPILATVYGNKASALMNNDYGQEKEAFGYLEKAISILENNHGDSQSNMAQLLLWKADLYCEQGNFEKAVPLLEEAKAIYKMLYGEISDYVIDIDLKLGNCYVFLRNENSYRYLYYAVARYKDMYGESSYRMIEPYIMLGDCFYYKLGEGSTETQKDKAIDYYNKAEEILGEFDNINTLENAYIYEKLGSAWYMLHSDWTLKQREGDMKKSLLCYKKAQDIYVIREQEKSEENLWLSTRIGRIYAYLGDKDMAIKCLEFVESNRDSINNESKQLTIYLDMLGICEVISDKEKSREYANFLKSIIDSSPTAAEKIGSECVRWINNYAD